MNKSLLIFIYSFAFIAEVALAQRTETTAPHNGFRNIMTYDANNNKVSDIEQELLNNIWQDIGINKAVYDKNNNVLSSVSQYGLQCFFTYDDRNNRTSFTRQYEKDHSYVNVERYYYTYDTQNTKTSEIMQQAKETDWVNFSQTFFSHDTTLSQSWNGTEWINSNRTSITYDAQGNKTSELAQYWKNNTWINHERWTYTNDANGKQINYVDETWDGNKWGPWQPMRDGKPR